ncbi:plasmid mobilization relaxosome protein MobC [Neisseria gonorrhoeae]|uniref:plasmid mobilization relaxosome protein MobC n=1 Tax=Neisseria gonorrhoeae TaxID=485 RepID=UPI001E54A689|nr:plasmid mobilization relaxosome protein MobC [Neisseria gonorrhoeae]
MGNNLNQIAKALNTAAKVGTLGNVEALKATTELAALERSLNSLRDFLAKKRTDGSPNECSFSIGGKAAGVVR